MFNHITPPSSGSDHNEQAAEPPTSRRFADQRGIALQTIIIMVVLLAIAGAVAAVLFQRAGTETTRLRDSESNEVYAITNSLLCTTSGYKWVAVNAMPSSSGAEGLGLAAVGITSVDRGPTTGTGTVDAADGYCKP